MKKIFVLLAILSPAQSIMGMEKKSSTGPLGRAAQTVFDKWDPTEILEELRKKGVSRDPRERMTQMHRLDRVVPAHIESQETEKLCVNLTTILTQDYPLSGIARTMAHDYLWRLRPSIRANKPLLGHVTATLDLLDPAQIIDDLQKGQIYSEESIDLENRLNRALERLVRLQRTYDLLQLTEIITTRKPAILPGKRVLQLAYAYLREQEKQNKAKKTLLVRTFGAEKSDSDVE